MYHIDIDYAPTQASNDVIRDGVFNSSKEIIGERDKDFSIFLKDGTMKILGGIQACLDTQSVYINLLWIDKSIRQKAYGTKLLAAAEQEGLKNDCIGFCHCFIFAARINLKIIQAISPKDHCRTLFFKIVQAIFLDVF